MNYNYHTHTYRCHHATETPEEYILRAIECGIKYMGFSDHAPFAFPGGLEHSHRVPMAERYDYYRELDDLRNKYADKIEIKIGFEMEYYPAYFGQMLEIAKECGGEYLILGQHHLGNGPTARNSVEYTECINDLKEYVDKVTASIKSGYFTYVAHPDILNFQGDEDLYKEQMSLICKCSKEENVPLEINFLGIRTKRNYPFMPFWQLAGEIGCPVTFGFDAHDAMNAYDEKSLSEALTMVDKYKLNYIGKPELKTL